MNVWTSSKFLFWSLVCCLFSWLAIGIQITCTSNINMNSSELTNLNPDQFQISQLQRVETIGSNPSRCKLSFRVKKIEQEFASRGIWFLLALGRSRESGMWHGLLLTDLLTPEIDMPFQETQATLFRKWSWTIICCWLQGFILVQSCLFWEALLSLGIKGFVRTVGWFLSMSIDL